jgi:hypothetical protein
MEIIVFCENKAVVLKEFGVILESVSKIRLLKNTFYQKMLLPKKCFYPNNVALCSAHLILVTLFFCHFSCVIFFKMCSVCLFSV